VELNIIVSSLLGHSERVWQSTNNGGGDFQVAPHALWGIGGLRSFRLDSHAIRIPNAETEKSIYRRDNSQEIGGRKYVDIAGKLQQRSSFGSLFDITKSFCLHFSVVFEADL
jgi:hypothetical protein